MPIFHGEGIRVARIATTLDELMSPRKNSSGLQLHVDAGGKGSSRPSFGGMLAGPSSSVLESLASGINRVIIEENPGENEATHVLLLRQIPLFRRRPSFLTF